MTCTYQDCQKVVYARGYCKYHYSKLRYYGELPKLPPFPFKKCSIDGCNNKHSAKGFCVKHYREYKIKNNPDVYKNIELKRQETARNNKQLMVRIMGGKCEICGYDKNIFCLEFHHRDPKLKKFSPRNLLRRGTIEEIKKELGKCMLLCRNCHMEIHHPVIEEAP